MFYNIGENMDDVEELDIYLNDGKEGKIRKVAPPGAAKYKNKENPLTLSIKRELPHLT